MPKAPEISLMRMTSPRPAEILPFIAQPILRTGEQETFGFEVLYRGDRPANWPQVDRNILEFLARSKVTAPLFVNLSNETVQTVDESLLFAAHNNNNIFFEWSEAISDDKTFLAIVKKINDWSRRGLCFVIDDFGAGRDSLQRLFALDHVAAVKFDGGLVQLIPHNPMAKNLVSFIVKACAQKGILTVGECVENREQYQMSEQVGFDLVQGWHVDSLYATTPQYFAMQA